MDELARLLLNIASAVPGGVVVFAPSFAYLSRLEARWAASGALRALGARKRVFLEPRASGDVEAALRAYAACCQPPAAAAAVAPPQSAAAPPPPAAPRSGSGGVSGGPSGALMLAVVGGKLSEGINFGDDLGRCVVMLGLPYPNPSDPELRERMRFYDAAAAAAAAASASQTASAPADAPAGAGTAAGAAGGGTTTSGRSGGGGGGVVRPLSGRDYYESLCTRAVNQSVGRVIRHAGDYAAVVLADARYAAGCRPGGGGDGGPLGRLPAWMQPAVVRDGGGDFGPAFGRLAAFFRRRRAIGEADGPAVAAT